MRCHRAILETAACSGLYRHTVRPLGKEKKNTCFAPLSWTPWLAQMWVWAYFRSYEDCFLHCGPCAHKTCLWMCFYWDRGCTSNFWVMGSPWTLFPIKTWGMLGNETQVGAAIDGKRVREGWESYVARSTSVRAADHMPTLLADFHIYTLW